MPAHFMAQAVGLAEVAHCIRQPPHAGADDSRPITATMALGAADTDMTWAMVQAAAAAAPPPPLCAGGPAHQLRHSYRIIGEAAGEHSLTTRCCPASAPTSASATSSEHKLSWRCRAWRCLEQRRKVTKSSKDQSAHNHLKHIASHSHTSGVHMRVPS